jgi:hypothetical protein
MTQRGENKHYVCYKHSEYYKHCVYFKNEMSISVYTAPDHFLMQ